MNLLIKCRCLVAAKATTNRQVTTMYQLSREPPSMNMSSQENNFTIEYLIEGCSVYSPALPLPPYIDLILWPSLVLVCLVGTPISLAVVHYDWYGGDPQKRSLGNRIISNGFLGNIFACFCCFALALCFR